jgi:hypothetical protein
MKALSRILSGTRPCIGVLKSRENLEHTASVLGLGNHYLDLRAELEEQILRYGELLEYGTAKEAVTGKLRQAIAQGMGLLP